jgi:hypothetical protein
LHSAKEAILVKSACLYILMLALPVLAAPSEYGTEIGVNAGLAVNSAWSTRLPVTDPIPSFPFGISFVFDRNHNLAFLIDAEYFRKGSMAYDTALYHLGYRVTVHDSSATQSVPATWLKATYDYLQFNFGLRLATSTEKTISIGVEIQPYISFFLFGHQTFGISGVSAQNDLPAFKAYKMDLGAQAAVVFGGLIFNRWAWLKIGGYSSLTTMDDPYLYIHRGFLVSLAYEFLVF